MTQSVFVSPPLPLSPVWGLPPLELWPLFPKPWSPPLAGVGASGVVMDPPVRWLDPDPVRLDRRSPSISWTPRLGTWPRTALNRLGVPRPGAGVSSHSHWLGLRLVKLLSDGTLSKAPALLSGWAGASSPLRNSEWSR